MNLEHYYGKPFELGAIQKVASLAQDKLSNSEAEQRFDESFKNREDAYLACARMVRDGLELPPHKMVNLYNGLLNMVVSHYSPADSLTKDDIQKNLGYVPPKLELSIFMNYFNNPTPLPGTPKVYEFKQDDIDLFKKPGMIELFKEDMKGCFDKLNKDLREANLSREHHGDYDTGYNAIRVSHNRRVTQVEKFFQISAMLDKNYGTELVKDFNQGIGSYINNVKADVKNKQDNVAFGLMIDTGAHDCENILKFSKNYEIANSLNKSFVSKNIAHVKEKLFGKNKENTNAPSAP